MRTIDMEGRQDRLWGWPIFRFLKIWRQASLSYRQRLRVNGSRVYPQIIFDTLLFLSEKVLTVQIEYIENEERQALFESIESMINAYDKALSEKANDVDYFADAYLSIMGAELDEEGVMRIRDNRIINIFGTDDASKIVVEFLQKPDGDTTQEHLLDRLERLIYQIAMVSNINDESFGNASGVALEFKLQPMKNLAAMKERKFTSGMNRRFKMLFNLPTNIEASKKDEWRNLNYRFTRNIPRNIADEADTASSLQGVVSKKTQLSVLSIVDNVDDEIEKMAEENNSSTSGYATDSSGGFIATEES